MNFYFILVKPAIPENIGAAARALKTMGFYNLRLVGPAAYQNTKARKLAHGSADVLNNTQVFSSLNEAVEGIDFIIGTTAKQRSTRFDYYDCSEIPEIIRKKGNTIRSTGIVFGREESGLTNEELNRCDLVTRIPIKNKYPSLNLAQAVMVYAYVLSVFTLQKQEDVVLKTDQEGLKELKVKVDIILKDLQLDQNMNLYKRILERLMVLQEDDIHLLHSVTNRYFEKQ